MDHSPAPTPTAPPALDYEADEVLVVDDAERLRALADDLRTKIVFLLRERAASTTELARLLQLPKGTVAHHVKVLERAGLIRVVRTRQVRAVTEKYYGRVARLFVLQGADAGRATEDAIAAGIRQAADEVAGAAEVLASASIHLRLGEHDVKLLQARLKRLITAFRERETTDGELLGLAAVLYRTENRCGD